LHMAVCDLHLFKHLFYTTEASELSRAGEGSRLTPYLGSNSFQGPNQRRG